ncbi:hypothetical protein HDR70_00840 [bacterium]|nr:hypothetical protein [Bacteroides sp.]MBD5386425.1 hypothetical protein [bacterium]
MKRIDICKWKPFTLESLFDIVKGSRLTKQNMKEGTINYIGASAFNNGITNHIGNTENIHPGGTLTVAYNGSVGQTFYQEEPFWATDDVNVLYPKFDMTKSIALFIAPLIRSVGRNYEYIDKWEINDMRISAIYLPVLADGTPDWKFMDSYMLYIENKIQNTVNQINTILGGVNCRNLNNHMWQPFRIGDFLTAKNTGNILASDIEDGSGSTPFVTASGVNNGVAGYIDASMYEILKGNCILVGGKTFTLTYQKDDFVSNDSHNFTLRLCDGGVYDNEDVYLFLLTVIRSSLTRKYSWDDAVTSDKLLNETIVLPVTSNKIPDWRLMKSYVKTMRAKVIHYISTV